LFRVSQLPFAADPVDLLVNTTTTATLTRTWSFEHVAKVNRNRNRITVEQLKDIAGGGEFKHSK
jgi:hypothetical protein